jgi:molybdopterin-guanine dinucleotide biosynthesis protein A
MQLQPMPLHPAAEGFILAGGASSRFGSPKSLAMLVGHPLIAHAIHLLDAVGISARIAGDHPSPAPDPLASYAPIIADEHPGRGPLSGVHAALLISQAQWNIFIPIDMPLIPPALLECLLRRASLTHAPVTCFRVNGLLQPFPVVLDRSILPQVTDALTGSASCFRLWQSFDALDAPRIESLLQSAQIPADNLPPTLWFRSVNTVADLALVRHGFALRAPSLTLEA